MTGRLREAQGDPFRSVRTFQPTPGTLGRYHALAALEEAGLGQVSRLPVCLRIVLESLLRQCDGRVVTEQAVRALAAWRPRATRTEEIPFLVARVVIPDSSGIPLLADLAAMRDAAGRVGRDPRLVNPTATVDLIVDHSVQVDYAGTADALDRNMALELDRNGERYGFVKWAAQAFETVAIVPPGFGIIHQINLEYLSPGVHERNGMFYPDTLVGADSHTPMINGLGVVGWGVGGIEAEAGMLGQPIYVLTPDVVGVELRNRLRPGITATDAVLTIVQRLRAEKVVDAFVEYFGEGAACLGVADRATIANMTPETGATVGYFPPDERTADYYAAVGRDAANVSAFREYFIAQSLWGIPRRGDIDYSRIVEIDLDQVEPSVAGPSRPQDRLPVAAIGAGAAPAFGSGRPARPDLKVRDCSVVVAAITSCTNTSNPGLMLAAGLLAKKAVARGLSAAPWVKTSFSPGSRSVSSYLEAAGLQSYLNRLGFQPVGYGCMSCIGNSGPLDPAIEREITDNGLTVASVLSGNRNFEARIHPAVKSNFLMSPPLVVAFAIAGRIDIDLDAEPLGEDAAGNPVALSEIWPSEEEIAAVMHHALDPAEFRRVYAGARTGSEAWQALGHGTGPLYQWAENSTYLKPPPFFEAFGMTPLERGGIVGARALAIFGDSITTDHISPGGRIDPASAAGQYLLANGVEPEDFNSYIARRANHQVMVRGTFANVRIRNLMRPGEEGGVTAHQPDGKPMGIHAAAALYAREGVPLVVIAGQDYGTGSSRDWAAKGTALLGVRAVIAGSFERIHRSNLVGMGVLPCEFMPGTDAGSLGLRGDELYDLVDVGGAVTPRQIATLRIRGAGMVRECPVLVRVETPTEADYLRHGGILPYVLRFLLEREDGAGPMAA